MTSPDLAPWKERYPRIDDPAEAIRFALSLRDQPARDFLCCWAEGAWDEIEQAYPEYLEKVRT